MRLFIAEKPSLGRAIADTLKKPLKKHEGYIEAADGDIVTWCIGHLLEQEEPQSYDPAYKQWQLHHLPIIPTQWQLKPRKESAKQITVIRKLLKRADIIVHAGDPDREGQLLVDELLNFLNLSGARKQAVRRLLINDLNPKAVSKAIANMQYNRDFVPLSISALARSRADWLYGINMTRACTLLGRNAGFNGLLSIGRVQTPILGLVVQRDITIAQFEPKAFFEVLAHLRTQNNETFIAKWLPSKACQPWMDEEGRVLNKNLAENVASRIKDKQGMVVAFSDKQGKENPPLPFSLSALQIDAAKLLKLNAQQVLDSCQRLYEQKLITYPRSDNRYLPQGHFKEAVSILTSLRHNVFSLTKAIDGADSDLKSAAWNDKKVEAHHAIIPTSVRTDLERLSATDRSVYTLIAQRYIVQFYAALIYSKRTIDVQIEGGLFRATSTMTLDLGWKAVTQASTKTNNKSDQSDEIEQILPALKKGDKVHCFDSQVVDKMTQPPKPFNDASLLSALTGIARFVADKDIRQTLKETDGLGTEATRAGIIELLFKRQFLVRHNKNIHATPAGRALITALPAKMTTPDMTAQWEQQLSSMVKRTIRYDDFMNQLNGELNTQLACLKQTGLPQLAQLSASDIPQPKKTWRKPSSRASTHSKASGSRSYKKNFKKN